MLIRWTIYGICLFFSGVVFILYSQYMAFYFIALLITVPSLSLLLFILAIKLIVVNIAENSAVILCNSKNTMPIRIKNSWLLLFIKMTMTIDKINRWQHETSKNNIKFNRNSKYAYSCSNELCGKTEIHIKKIRYYDIFHLFSYEKKYSMKHITVAMPEQMIKTDCYQQKMLSSVQPISEKVFTAVKPYQAGDDVRHIHWPVTAMRDDIYIKEYSVEQLSENKLVIFDSPLTKKFNNAVYEAFYELARCLLQKYNIFYWCYLGQDNKIYCQQIENEDILNYKLSEFMKTAQVIIDYTEKWPEISMCIPADCQQIVYITTSDNSKLKSMSKLYPYPQMVIINDNDIEYTDETAVYINKNELPGSLFGAGCL